jgi:hypothetical protein
MPSQSKTVHEQTFDARLDLAGFLLSWREGTFPLTGLAVWSDIPTFGMPHVSEVAVPTLKQNVTEVICSFKSGIKRSSIALKTHNTTRGEAKQKVMATKLDNLFHYTTMLQNLMKKIVLTVELGPSCE